MVLLVVFFFLPAVLVNLPKACAYIPRAIAEPKSQSLKDTTVTTETIRDVTEVFEKCQKAHILDASDALATLDLTYLTYLTCEVTLVSRCLKSLRSAALQQESKIHMIIC